MWCMMVLTRLFLREKLLKTWGNNRDAVRLFLLRYRGDRGGGGVHLHAQRQSVPVLQLAASRKHSTFGRNESNDVRLVYPRGVNETRSADLWIICFPFTGSWFNPPTLIRVKILQERRLFRTESRSSVQTSSWPAAGSSPSFACLTSHDYRPNYPPLGGPVRMAASQWRRSRPADCAFLVPRRRQDQREHM